MTHPPLQPQSSSPLEPVQAAPHASAGSGDDPRRIGREPDGSSARRRGTTIVIADDEAHIRLVVGEKFRSEGFTVVEARDGEEALELVREHRPDVIVTDLQMPYMTGVELCAKVAADPMIAHIPALLLTARGHIVDPSVLNETVIRRTMAKPFSAKTLFENVLALVAQAEAGVNVQPASGAAAGRTRATVFDRAITGEAA